MGNTHPAITIIGAGYVGLTTAAILANCGYQIYLVDIDQSRLKVIRSGRSFFYEPGLDKLVSRAIKNQALIATDSYQRAVPESDFIFSCVGTPDNPDGSPNLNYVFDAAKECLRYIKAGAVFVQKSTVPVGTGQAIEKLPAGRTASLKYVSNPEFLRESTAITDTLYFDRVVCGGDDRSAAQAVEGVYKSIEACRDRLLAAAGLAAPNNAVPGKYILTSRNSAELIKVTANAFLALKISFANSIAKLADHTEADVVEVMNAVGADHRIGRDFLNAGRGYGGGCFPKDVSGLISSAAEHGVDMQIMTAATDLNASMPGYIANKASHALGGLEGCRVAVLGLAFKANTSDARKSPSVSLANILAKNGASVNVYDPQAIEEAAPDLTKPIQVQKDLHGAVDGADAVFVATDWPEFTSMDLAELAGKMHGKLFVDCMNKFDVAAVMNAGLDYIGVGRNGSKVS